MNEPCPIVVVSAVLPEDGYSPEEADLDERFPSQDRPRLLRAQILTELFDHKNVRFVQPPLVDNEGLGAYLEEDVHSSGLLDFFQTAWSRWQEDMGEELPLYPSDFGLPRISHLRPSQNVIGRMGYYCTDMGTPIYNELRQELNWDVLVVKKALDELMNHNNELVYAMPLHSGHHAAHDSFGGGCYLNHAAFAAVRLQKRLGDKVAVLDLAYRCGNGTASICRNHANILVASLHCHPDHGYPYHTGLSGDNDMKDSIHYFPIVPGNPNCRDEHRKALNEALNRIDRFGAKVLVVSLAIDLHGFGFHTCESYHGMGRRIGAACWPCLVVQEGGGSEASVGQSTASFLAGLSVGR